MSLQLDQIVWESERKHLRIGWYDPEQTILVLQVLDRWTWEEATVSIVNVMNPLIVAKAPQPVYTIITHDRYARFAPRGGNALSALRQMMQTDPPNEVLAIFVRQSDVIRTFLDVIVRLYKTANKTAKHRFVETFEDALAQVAEHKAQAARSAQAG